MHVVQDASKIGVKLYFVCLAGNHSAWAAQKLLGEGAPNFKPEQLKYRQAHVFTNINLTEDMKLILAGMPSY